MDSSPSTASHKGALLTVILLCLPAVVGTGYFLIGAVALEFNLFGEAPPVDWGPSTTSQDIVMGAIFTMFMALYAGATLGPLLLPFAGYGAFRLTRSVGLRSRMTIWAWTFVGLGLVASALFWKWLINLDLFI